MISTFQPVERCGFLLIEYSLDFMDFDI